MVFQPKPVDFNSRHNTSRAFPENMCHTHGWPQQFLQNNKKGQICSGKNPFQVPIYNKYIRKYDFFPVYTWHKYWFINSKSPLTTYKLQFPCISTQNCKLYPLIIICKKKMAINWTFHDLIYSLVLNSWIPKAIGDVNLNMVKQMIMFNVIRTLKCLISYFHKIELYYNISNGIVNFPEMLDVGIIFVETCNHVKISHNKALSK